MAEDQRRDRIRKRHRGDDLGADLRMDADLLELFLRQRPGLRQDVLGHRELADVVEQRRRLHALDSAVATGRPLRQAGRIQLHAADVRLRRLILRVDRARQRFDRRQVQIRGLLHVPLLVLDAAHVDLVGAVGQIERRERQRREPVAGVRDEPDRERRACRRRRSSSARSRGNSCARSLTIGCRVDSAIAVAISPVLSRK